MTSKHSASVRMMNNFLFVFETYFKKIKLWMNVNTIAKVHLRFKRHLFLYLCSFEILEHLHSRLLNLKTSPLTFFFSKPGSKQTRLAISHPFTTENGFNKFSSDRTLAVWHVDLSSLTRDLTHIPCVGSMEY